MGSEMCIRDRAYRQNRPTVWHSPILLSLGPPHLLRAVLTGKHDTLVRTAPGWQGAPDGQQTKISCYKTFILLSNKHFVTTNFLPAGRRGPLASRGPYASILPVYQQRDWSPGMVKCVGPTRCLMRPCSSYWLRVVTTPLSPPETLLRHWSLLSTRYVKYQRSNAHWILLRRGSK